MTPRRWIEYLAAVLVGNGIYFLVLFPGLPRFLQHQPFRFDAGLALAFLCCVGIYGVIRMASRHAQRWNRRSLRGALPEAEPPAGADQGPKRISAAPKSTQ